MSAPTGPARSASAADTVKVRLSGTRRGCAEAAKRLHAVFYVTNVSESYQEAGSTRLVQVYVRVRLDLRPELPPAASPAPGGEP